MFSNFCLKQKDNLDAWHCLLGKYSLLILYTPLSPSSEAEYKTALANSPISQIISNETQLFKTGGNCKLSVKGPKLHEVKITLYTVTVKKQSS